MRAHEFIVETSSAGATGASSIASAVGQLGSPLTRNASIYRTPGKKKKKKKTNKYMNSKK